MTRLGRNPFEKKAAAKPTPRRATDFMHEEAEETRVNSCISAKIGHFLFVDFKAEAIVLGLKAYLLSLSLLD